MIFKLFQLQPIHFAVMQNTWLSRCEHTNLILCYLSGVKTLHKLMNVNTDAFQDMPFRLTVMGLARNNTHVPRQAPPITPKILKDIHALLDFSVEEDLLFWAVVLVGFFLLLRKSNLVPDTSKSFNGGKQIKRSDLQFEQDHVKVTLNWLKNSQYGKTHRFALPHIPGSILCPVEALCAVFDAIQAAPHDSIFTKSDGSVYTYPKLQAKLAWVSQKLGIEKLTSHSLRAGGATNAFLSGVPGELIQILGHWKSSCYLKYLRLPKEARMAAGVLVKYRILALEA